MKRPTTYCDRCESTVYADDVHSCFDAKAEREQRERERALTIAERAVVEAALKELATREAADKEADKPVLQWENHIIAKVNAEWRMAWHDYNKAVRALATLTNPGTSNHADDSHT